jgi:hypothetical protein
MRIIFTKKMALTIVPMPRVGQLPLVFMILTTQYASKSEIRKTIASIAISGGGRVCFNIVERLPVSLA